MHRLGAADQTRARRFGRRRLREEVVIPSADLTAAGSVAGVSDEAASVADPVVVWAHAVDRIGLSATVTSLLTTVWIAADRAWRGCRETTIRRGLLELA